MLIIDEWFLRLLPESEAYVFLKIIEACSKSSALTLCTQYDTDEWYFCIDCDRSEYKDSAVAEGILARSFTTSMQSRKKVRISMPKRHAFTEFGKIGVTYDD